MTPCLFECEHCPLSRSQSNARAITEDIIVHDSQYQDHTHIVYASYGAGGLGFEARLLYHLIEKQFEHITIIIIDPQYHSCHTKHISHLHTYHTSNVETQGHGISQRIATFVSYLTNHATKHTPNTKLNFHVFTSAIAYYQTVTQQPDLRADICTWIDPEIPVQPDNPYTENDAYYLPMCLHDRACDYILTINNVHEPVLITGVYEHIIIQRTHYTIPTKTTEHMLYLNKTPVYPYDPAPEAIQIGNNIYPPENRPICISALRLLHQLCHEQQLHRICIPSYVRNQLDKLSVYSAPG